MSIVSESFSTGFGVDGVIIEQTLFNSFDPYSGMDIDTSSFQNTNQGLENSNQDGRIELGMFTFDNDNQNSNNYPDILGSDFKVISKTNLIENGSGKYSLSIFKNPATGENEGYYIPQGGWGYCTYDGIEDRRRGELLYESNDDYSTGAYLEAGQTGRDFADTFVNGTYPYPELKDNQKRTGYAGYYAYFFDYRNLPADYEFTTTTIYANDEGGNTFSDTKTWNTATQQVDANNMPESWVRNYNDNEDSANYGEILSMHIDVIEEVATGKELFWDSLANYYVNNSGNGFTEFKRGNKYKFTFKTDFDDGEAVPTIDSLEWSAFFNYREELQAFNEYRDEPIPLGAPLRLQQNLRHAIEQSNTENTCTNFLFMNHYDAFVGNHDGEYLLIDSDLGGYAEGSLSYAPVTNITTPFAAPRGWIDSPSVVSFPNIAKWIISNEAFSYGKCLEFLSTDFDESQENISADNLLEGEGYNTDRGFHWSVISPDFTDFGGATENQYRSLNQVIKFYDGGSDASSFLEPYSSIKVSFKMKTDSRFVGNYPQPEVELAVVDSDGDIYSPSRTLDFTQYDEVNGAGVFPYNKRHIYYPDGGEFNSQAYRDEYHTDNTVDKRTSFYGSVGRFKNSIMDEWEEFSYTFVLGDKFLYHQSQQLRRLFLIVQAANRFYGRVLLDDFEVVESYDFTPDVDVRKKISNGNYGKADLTKYYDKDLQPEQYKDSTAPLEAQFYFYPTYPTDEIFDVTRTPIYNDFKKGLFYIKDVDWGDGSAIEFSEPEQIDEEKALYHTYEEYGIFEVSGLMIRKKVDENDEELGVVHVKKFNLRININEGLDEDFNYFSDNGFSFIPYKNTLPVVGGISKQSAYYKSVKRQMGFIDNSKTFVEFKNKSDKLKTELALLKMENQNIDNLEVLPSYMIERYSVNNIFTIQWPGSDLEVNTTNIPDNIISIVGDDGVMATFVDGNWIGTLLTLQFGETYSFITSVPLYNFSWDIISDNNLNLLPPSSNIIYNGISPIKEELGKGIGDCDLTSVKYYNEPKSIWELFGFEIVDTSAPLDAFDYIDTTPEYLMTLPFPQYFEELDIQTLGALNQEDVGTWVSPLNARPDIGQLISQIVLGNGTENNPQLNQYNYPDYVFDWQSTNDIPFGNDLSQPHSDFTNPTAIAANQIINESVGNPASIRYWKNIIPKDYPIFHRDGLVDFLKISPPLDALKQYDSSDATTTFENLPLGLIPSGNLPDVEGWNGNNFNSRFLMGYWDMGIVEIDDLPGYEKAIRIVTRYSENSPYDNRSWGGFYRSFITANNIPTMFGGWFKVLNGGMEYGNLNTLNRISKNPDYGNSNNGWEFFVSPLNESSFQSDSEGNGCHFYSWVNESNPDGEVLIAGLFAFNDEEFFTTLHNFVESGEEQDYKLGFNTYSTRNIVDTYAEQDWFGDYYYPALPKYGQDGKFIEDTLVDNKIPFPLQGPITDETESNENLIINIISETTEDNVFDDKSGNENLGFGISDYKPKFNNETLKPLKRNTFNKIKTSKRNGAF